MIIVTGPDQIEYSINFNDLATLISADKSEIPISKTILHDYYKRVGTRVSKKFLGYKKGDFPIAEKLAEKSISLPVHEFISEEESSKMVDIINYCCLLNIFFPGSDEKHSGKGSGKYQR